MEFPKIFDQLIQDRFKDTEKTVFVMKGLDLGQCTQSGLKRLIDPVEDYDTVTDRFKDIGKQVLNHLMTSENYLLSYEDFLLIMDNIINFLQLYDYHVVIINNNIYHYLYPLSGSFDPQTVREQIDSHQDSPYNRIFSDYTVVKGKVYVEYTGYDENELISQTDLFSYEDHPWPIGEEDEQERLSLGTTEETYLEFLHTLSHYTGKEINIAVDKNELYSYHRNILLILQHYGYQIRLLRRSVAAVADEKTEEYRKILKRKNSDYDFRILEFYKNPGYSLETSKVSQSEIISALVNNAVNACSQRDYNDIFVTAPTGSGKSVLFQIPAIYLAEKYDLLTLVITPLIGLMNDQIENIKTMTDCAATINSEYTPDEKEEIKNKISNNEISILYVSPETLLSNSPITNLIGDRQIGLMVVDEAHIVSTWGKSFRPDYWFLGDYISYLRTKMEYRFPIATFSATVTYGGDDDMHGDIIDSLKMRTGEYEYIAPMRRDDIHFQINLMEKDKDYLQEKEKAVEKSLNQLLKDNRKTIVYFPFTKQVNEYTRKLSGTGSVVRYTGKLLKQEKTANAMEFKSGKSRMILATKAFGMGIDIDDVEEVYHYAPTGNLCDYVQEIGRAARREDIQGIARTDYYKEDFRYISQLHGMSSIKNYQVVETLKKIRKTYEMKKTRNFTVSPDEFSYIFPSNYDMQAVDASFKTVMLMIEKDFEKDPRLNFKPLIFKSRSMFTESYFLVKPELVKKVRYSKFRKYFRKYAASEDLETEFSEKQVKSFVDSHTFEKKEYVSVVENRITYQGDIYTLDMKKMWEENYNDRSFAKFKYDFYQGNLKNFRISKELIPEYILTIHSLNQVNFNDRILQLKEILDEIIMEFSKEEIQGKYLDPEEMAALFMDLKSIRLGKYEAMLASENFIEIINRFSTANNFATQYVFKKNSGTDQTTMSSLNLLKKRIKAILRETEIKFSTVLNSDHRVFLLKQNMRSDIQNSHEILIAQLLEMLHFASYQVKTGERPEYFIRVNSITAIDRILENQNYQSEMVRLVHAHYLESIDIMDHFFSGLKTDQERWDYIEKYFVGLAD